jgi:hypothetical protein
MRRLFVSSLLAALAAVLLAAAAVQARPAAETPTTTTSATTTASATAADPLKHMTEALARANTLRMQMTMTMRIQGVSQPLVITASGSQRTSPTFTRLSMDMSRLMTAAGRPAGQGRFVMIVADDAGKARLYMRGGPFAELLPKGRTWVVMNPATISKLTGSDIEKQLLGSADPRAQFDVYAKLGTKVDELGKGRIDGVAVTEYHVEIPVANLLKAGIYTETQLKQLRKALPEGTKVFGYDLWLDASGFPRRMALTMPLIQAGEVIEQDIDLRYLAPGRPIKTELPPQRLTHDITQLMIDQLRG